jgi:acetylglutamate kinase
MSRIVVKCGGAVAAESGAAIMQLVEEGHEVCVVHGAGKQISALMAGRGLPVQFVGGRRVTSRDAIEVVKEALDRLNAELCASLGPLAVGLHGDEIGLRARPVMTLGLVGDPLPSRPAAVEDALAAGLIPVVTPLAMGPLNVNADEAAAALAVGIEAERIVFLTDVPGLLLGGAVTAVVRADEAERMLDADDFEGGIVPKLRAAITAARLGVRAEIGETAVLA